MEFRKSHGLHGEITVPGDKSISHRAVMFGSIAKGTTEIHNFLQGADCLSTIACFQKMGIDIEQDRDHVLVRGNGLYGLKKPQDVLDCGNSGTTTRLISGILCAQEFDVTLTGDESIRKRPMKRIMEPLSLMGADITSLNGNREMFELEVPYNPERIAILDMASMDILDNLGVGDRIVGSASTSLDYLQQYVTNDNVANLGTIKEADLEAVMACEPDIIFIGGRLSKSYDDLSEIAPVVYLATDTEKGVVESVGANARTIASIFGLEDQVDDKIAGFEDRIAALRSFAEGKNAIVGLVTSGGLNVLGNDGRCSVIGREIGFENIGVDANIDTSTHGNEASFEFIVEKNPQYLFIMDRDAAIQSEGAKLAQEIVENELVMGTDVYKNGNIIYLAHPAVWYTAEGGITALDLMLQDLETALLD